MINILLINEFLNFWYWLMKLQNRVLIELGKLKILVLHLLEYIINDFLFVINIPVLKDFFELEIFFEPDSLDGFSILLCNLAIEILSENVFINQLLDCYLLCVFIESAYSRTRLLRQNWMQTLTAWLVAGGLRQWSHRWPWIWKWLRHFIILLI